MVIALRLEGPLDGCAFAWRLRQGLRVSVVAKATFAFDRFGAAAPLDAARLVRDEPAQGGDPCDVAPWLDRAQIVVVGVPEATRRARLAVERDGRRWVDKVVEGSPAEIAAALGPIPSPAARAGVRDVTRAVMELPAALASDAFQCVPADQRLDAFGPASVICLEGLSPLAPALRVALPPLALEVEARTGPIHIPVYPRHDTVIVHASASRCSLLWRANFGVGDERALADLAIVARLRTAAAAPARPQTLPFQTAGAAPPRLATDLHRGADDGGSGTMALPQRIPRAAATPFEPGAPGDGVATEQLSRQALREAAKAAALPFESTTKARVAPRAVAPIAGAPWSDAKVAEVPPPSPGSETVALPRIPRAPAAPPPPPEAPAPAAAAVVEQATPWATGPKDERTDEPQQPARKNLNALIYDAYKGRS
jgi:hypothetical protein